MLGSKRLDGLHQADIAFGDDFGHRQAVIAIAHGDFRNKAQMAGDELVGGFDVLFFLPALSEFALLFGSQHREGAQRGEVAREAVFRRERGCGNRQMRLSFLRLSFLRLSFLRFSLFET